MAGSDTRDSSVAAGAASGRGGVTEGRRSTATQRRANIIRALRQDLTLDDPELSKALRFAERLESEERVMVVNADIDGIVSAHMLAAVSPWRIGVLVDRRGVIRKHPSIASVEDLIVGDRAFGVDVFSARFPGVSNHPVLFGAGPQVDATHNGEFASFDAQVLAAVREHGDICPSAWVGISAAHKAHLATGMSYKYPLGSAQIMLALLETIERNPRFFDRQFLPYLVANCDGGLDSIRKYAWNVEPWWSAIAACVGPGSLSDALYRLATEQRPGELGDVDRRLKWDEPDRSRYLTEAWNLVSASPAALRAITGLLDDLSGWGDPYLGGAANLDSWVQHTSTTGVLRVDGLTKKSPEVVKAHLEGALSAVHMNISQFADRGVALGWVLPEPDHEVEKVIGGETLASMKPAGPSLADV